MGKSKKKADLFGVTVSNINKYIKNVFDEDELIPESVIEKYSITASSVEKDFASLVQKVECSKRDI